jgi:hypothetical protein
MLFVGTLFGGGAVLAVVHHWGWWFLAGAGVLLIGVVVYAKFLRHFIH